MKEIDYREIPKYGVLNVQSFPVRCLMNFTERSRSNNTSLNFILSYLPKTFSKNWPV